LGLASEPPTIDTDGVSAGPGPAEGKPEAQETMTAKRTKSFMSGMIVKYTAAGAFYRTIGKPKENTCFINVKVKQIVERV